MIDYQIYIISYVIIYYVIQILLILYWLNFMLINNYLMFYNKVNLFLMMLLVQPKIIKKSLQHLYQVRFIMLFLSFLFNNNMAKPILFWFLNYLFILLNFPIYHEYMAFKNNLNIRKNNYFYHILNLDVFHYIFIQFLFLLLYTLIC